MESATHGWRRRRLLAGFVRVASSLAPLTVSFAVGITGHTTVPAVDGTFLSTGRWLLILVASLTGLVVTDKLARRFLPLAALLQLSLSFPDQTPSRFRMALRQGSSRRRARLTAEAKRSGVSDEPTLAAEQLVLLAGSIGDHDRRTRGHSERVRLYADLIGEELGLDADERDKLQWAALIHDVGKLSVPAEILNKKGKPDDREWTVLRGHPEAGEHLVENAEAWLGEWVAAVGGHHERWDGTGYPRGLRGEQIPRAASIVAVADAFEVMTAARSYKKGVTLAEARQELTRCAGTHFSPEVVRAMLNVSIGRVRRSMGIMAAIAHVPFLGRVSTAAAYAPDTVSAAVGATTSAAGAGAGAVAVTAALAVSAPAAAMPAASSPSLAPLPQPVSMVADGDALPVGGSAGSVLLAAMGAVESSLAGAAVAPAPEVPVPADEPAIVPAAADAVALTVAEVAPPPAAPPTTSTTVAAPAPTPAPAPAGRPAGPDKVETRAAQPRSDVAGERRSERRVPSAPAAEAGPPARAEAPARQPGPPAHVDAPVREPGPPAHVGAPEPGPPAHAGPPADPGPPVDHGPPTDPGPPVDHGPPTDPGPPVDHGPPADAGNGNGKGGGNPKG